MVIKNIKRKSNKTLLAFSPVAAGFPSPATDYIDKKLDLNEYLIKHPAATFFVKVRGNSMINAGISDGDLLVVDKSLDPRNEDIVIAVINAEFTVKRILKKGKELYLQPENKEYLPIKITENMDFCLWGVVIAVIKRFK